MNKTFPEATPEAFPFKAQRGTAVVTIYHKSRTKAGETYEQFRIPFQEDGQRKFHYFPTYDLARQKGNEMLDLLVKNEGSAITLKGGDKVVYNRALQSLDGTGVSLDRAAAEYAEYWKQMGGDFFKEAVAQFVERRSTIKVTKVPDLVELFITQKKASTKRGREASADYIKDLESRLGRFAKRFNVPVTSVRSDDVLDFLDELKMSARTRFNYARLLRTLFRFAQSRRYFPKDIDPMEGIDIDFDDNGEIEIFTVAELDRILKTARPELISFIAIGAFAGLRHTEIKRLDWQEIDLERGFIEVKGAKAKTRQRRLVPISENLKAWLATYHKKSGPVISFVHSSKQIMWLVDDINASAPNEPFRWKHNGLRHSFISYRVAEVQSADKVALEAGNSPQMIFKHYRELVRPEEAKQWFSIMPEKAANVIPLPAVA